MKQTHDPPPREFTPIISRLSNLGQILARLVKVPKFDSNLEQILLLYLRVYPAQNVVLIDKKRAF